MLLSLYFYKPLKLCPFSFSQKIFYPCVSDWIISITLYFRSQIIFPLLSILLLSISTEFFILVFVFFQSKMFKLLLLLLCDLHWFHTWISLVAAGCWGKSWHAPRTSLIGTSMPYASRKLPCVLHSHLRDRPLTT